MQLCRSINMKVSSQIACSGSAIPKCEDVLLAYRNKKKK